MWSLTYSKGVTSLSASIGGRTSSEVNSILSIRIKNREFTVQDIVPQSWRLEISKQLNESRAKYDMAVAEKLIAPTSEIVLLQKTTVVQV